jgi:hypothetical protein
MHRILLNTSTTISVVRKFARVSNCRNFRRSLAFLSSENDFLPNLLAEDGLVRFLKPPSGSLRGVTVVEDLSTEKDETHVNEHFIVKFSIDCNEASIKCHVSTARKSKQDANGVGWSINYPPYSPNTTAPAIRESVLNTSPKVRRVKELADTMWRSFCIHDFLSLQVKATLHPDGSMSFPECCAQVDESAAYRQGNIFEHVTRPEHPDELEAEKNLLVYHKYIISVIY